MNIEHETYQKLKQVLKNYNWDVGFTIPTKILNHPLCDLALAMEIFYLGDGYGYFCMLMNKGEGNIPWLMFISTLCDDIANGKYSKTRNTYQIPLTKTQIHKLRKVSIEDIFLEDIC